MRTKQRVKSLARRTLSHMQAHAPCIARFTVLHTEHCTLEAPLMYISSVLQPPHSSCAISVPAGHEGCMLERRATRR